MMCLTCNRLYSITSIRSHFLQTLATLLVSFSFARPYIFFKALFAVNSLSHLQFNAIKSSVKISFLIRQWHPLF